MGKSASDPCTDHAAPSSAQDINHKNGIGYKLLGLCGDCTLITSKLDDAVSTTPSTTPPSKLKLSFIYILHFIDCTGRNVGQVCFANNPISGFLILIGLAIGIPLVAVSTLLASTIGIAFALILRMPSSNVSAGLTCYNAALLGAVLPALLLDVVNPSALWISVATGALCTVVMTSSLANSLGSLQPAMPIFTVPFNLVALFTIVCLRVYQPSSSNSDPTVPPQFGWGKFMKGSVLGAGQVFAVQDFWCSGLVLLGVFISSPLLALAGFLGSLIATGFAIIVSPDLYEAAYAGIYGYNGFLAACAVCFFFVPTWRSVIVGLINTLLAAAVQVALAWAFKDCNLPVLTLPFVGASLLLLGITSSERALPRPRQLTYPEQHRIRWRRRDSADSNSSSASIP